MSLPIRENQQVDRSQAQNSASVIEPPSSTVNDQVNSFVPVSLLPTGVTAGLAPSWVLAWWRPVAVVLVLLYFRWGAPGV